MESDEPCESVGLDGLINAVEHFSENAGASAEACEALAQLVDTADQEGNIRVLKRAIELSALIEPNCMPIDACLVRYNCSNAWAALHRLECMSSEDSWSWDQPELLKQVYWLRSAIQHEGYALLPAARRAQFHCNLANSLSAAGRFVDALEEWRKALFEQPILGMARGNLGRGLITYGQALYDEGHAYWFLVHAHDALTTAVDGGVGRDGATYQEAIQFFTAYRDMTEAMLSRDSVPELSVLDEASIGKTKKERKYRRWCLDRNLFLNPMNDLGAYSIAGHDVLNLPTHSANDTGITYLAFFNQLKQEFAYARLCLYEGSTDHAVHFADREVSLSFNADYALYSMALEKIKTAFRSAYSVLDKVAYFVNAYWKLGISERQVYFRSIWFEESKGKGKPKRIREVFESSQNLPLRGLYWLAQDIYSEDLREVAHPSAKDLDALRNHLEHKYAKVVDPFTRFSEPADIFKDRLAHQIEKDDLIAKAKRLVVLSRSALIYLSLAMHVEEQRLATDESLSFAMGVDIYPDKLKR